MDEIYHQSKSKMLASMDAENVQSKPMKNQSETYTHKPKEATHFRRSLEINYSQGKRRFISFYQTYFHFIVQCEQLKNVHFV